MKTPRAGFTLIELLVVVTIIALLASILIPALLHARKLAESAVCLSNQRQLALASLIYAANYGDRFPVVCYWGDGTSPNPVTGTVVEVGWNRQDQWRSLCLYVLEDYILTPKTATCPARAGEEDNGYGGQFSYAVPAYLYLNSVDHSNSEGYQNTSLWGFISWYRYYTQPGWLNCPGAKLSEVTSPSNVIHSFERSRYRYITGGPDDGDLGALCNWWPGYFEMGSNSEYGVHVEGDLNFGFADGHAETFDMNTYTRDDTIFDTVWTKENIGWNVLYPKFHR